MTIEQQLQELRRKWKEYPEKRKIIELQARALQIALEKRGEVQIEEPEDIFKDLI